MDTVIRGDSEIHAIKSEALISSVFIWTLGLSLDTLLDWA